MFVYRRRGEGKHKLDPIWWRRGGEGGRGGVDFQISDRRPLSHNGWRWGKIGAAYMVHTAAPGQRLAHILETGVTNMVHIGPHHHMCSSAQSHPFKHTAPPYQPKMPKWDVDLKPISHRTTSFLPQTAPTRPLSSAISILPPFLLSSRSSDESRILLS